MQVTRTSIHSGITRTLEIDITGEQLQQIEAKEGYIQEIAAHLPADQREFLLSGITGKEWQEMFSGDEDSIEDYEYDTEPF